MVGDSADGWTLHERGEHISGPAADEYRARLAMASTFAGLTVTTRSQVNDALSTPDLQIHHGAVVTCVVRNVVRTNRRRRQSSPACRSTPTRLGDSRAPRTAASTNSDAPERTPKGPRRKRIKLKAGNRQPSRATARHTVVALADESGIPRQRLDEHHRDLLNEFKATVGRGTVNPNAKAFQLAQARSHNDELAAEKCSTSKQDPNALSGDRRTHP